MIWHCLCCGKYFPNGQKQLRRNADGRVLSLCPICGSQHIKIIK